MKDPKKILVIIQRSNGDVYLSMTLVQELYKFYKLAKIDLLVNDDTLHSARLIPNINQIHSFSYSEKKQNRYLQEKKIFKSIFRKYDISINLTASDRSVAYALLASKKSISAIEKEHQKSWWKKLLLTHYYHFDFSKHALLNNLEALNILKIQHKKLLNAVNFSDYEIAQVKQNLEKKGISQFIIFHPSSQYNYKIYPKKLRDILLSLLSSLGIPILITGSNNAIDIKIKSEIPELPNVYNFIGITSLKEFTIISQLSHAYIGMDTLNMHIAASQNKKIFAIFGPTNLKMWSPWSNKVQTAAMENAYMQTYGNITIFQSSLPCVACGKAGCDDNFMRSECLFTIKPEKIFSQIKEWYQNASI